MKKSVSAPTRHPGEGAVHHRGKVGCNGVKGTMRTLCTALRVSRRGLVEELAQRKRLVLWHPFISPPLRTNQNELEAQSYWGTCDRSIPLKRVDLDACRGRWSPWIDGQGKTYPAPGNREGDDRRNVGGLLAIRIPRRASGVQGDGNIYNISP